MAGRPTAWCSALGTGAQGRVTLAYSGGPSILAHGCRLQGAKEETMRPVETLLIVANLLTLLALAIPRPGVARCAGGMVLLALALAVVQVAVEGPRWQVIPALALAGLFALAWCVWRVGTARGGALPRRTQRFVAVLAVLLGVSGLGLSAALPLALPVIRFPRPSGPYAIGTTTYQWVDASRREVLSTDEGRRRALVVQVWYPAAPGAATPHAPYIRDADAVTTALATLHHLPAFTLHYLKYVTTNAVESVPMAADRPNYPVLIVLEGLTGYRQMTTFQVEELVSRGYIVVGLDQPGAAAAVVFADGQHLAITERFAQVNALVDQSLSPSAAPPTLNGQTFPDGLLPYLAQDVSFTLDRLADLNARDPQGRLTGRLDLAHVGVFGMSLGGMVAAEACLRDPRLGACLIVDVAMPADVVARGLRQPTMWITRPADTMRLERQRAGGWAERDVVQTQETMRSVYAGLPGDGYFVQIPGTFHIDFTDLSALSPLFPPLGFSGPLGSRRAHELVNAYTVAFFDRQLRGAAAGLLDGASAQYPEVIFSSRRLGPQPPP